AGRDAAPIVETAGAAAAAYAKALIEARFVMALRQRRSWDEVRKVLLDLCEKPEFAAKAMYLRPICGEKKDGLSSRFAEAVLRLMGNIVVDKSVGFDDEDKRRIHLMAIDLETNATVTDDVVIRKAVDRSSANNRQVLDGPRRNSEGKQVFLVRPTEDEM